MKKLLIICLCATGSWAFAQQDPMFTQYYMNEITLNPAYAGSHDVISGTLLYRHQWAGFEGAPVTQTFNVHSPLKNERIGTGVSIVNDQIGVTNSFNFYGSGSYMIPFGPNSHLSFGLQAGFTHIRINNSEVELGSEAPDPMFQEDEISGMIPNFGTGVYYESDRFYLGFSVPKILTLDLEVNGQSVEEVQQHYFLTAGYVFDLNPLWKLKTSTMVKATTGAPVNVDLSGDIIYDESYWFGLAYRSQESIDVMAMLQINNEFRLGYAYDYPINILHGYQGGTHEVLVNYRFSFEKSRVVTPRFF